MKKGGVITIILAVIIIISLGLNIYLVNQTQKIKEQVQENLDRDETFIKDLCTVTNGKLTYEDNTGKYFTCTWNGDFGIVSHGFDFRFPFS
jgi:hypothetical protein